MMRGASISIVICILFILIFSVCADPQSLPKYRPSKAHFKKDCARNALCNVTRNYPATRMKAIVRANRPLLKGSGAAMEAVIEHRSPLALRDDPIPFEKNLCSTKLVTIFPTVAEDVKKRLRYIVNVEEFRQGIVFESCTKKTCENHEVLYNFHTSCIQKYIKVRLWTLNKNGKLEYGIFKVPSTCVCAYKSYDE